MQELSFLLNWLHQLASYVKEANLGYIPYVIITLIITGFSYAFYMGCFKKIELKESQFGPMVFLYKEIQSSMKDLGSHYEALQKNSNLIFKFSNLAGIYHDDPFMVKRASDCRVSVGIFVNQGEERKISDFKKMFPEYKEKSIRIGRCLKSQFPFKNQFSYFLGPMRVYPLFQQYVQKNNIQHLDHPIEYYCDKYIEFIFPIGEQSQRTTNITTIPRPEYKQQYQCQFN